MITEKRWMLPLGEDIDKYQDGPAGGIPGLTEYDLTLNEDMTAGDTIFTDKNITEAYKLAVPDTIDLDNSSTSDSNIDLSSGASIEICKLTDNSGLVYAKSGTNSTVNAFTIDDSNNISFEKHPRFNSTIVTVTRH